MKYKIFFWFLFLILNAELNAQKISGFVQDNNGKKLFNAAISVKDIFNNTLAYTFSDHNGLFSINLTDGTAPEYIVVKLYGYTESSEKFDVNQLQYHFVLEKVIALETVNIIGKPPAIKVKKDTTLYRIENFTDGSEKKVEDVLKKLPGISVTEKGEIEFKGKKVDKVLIDGDDFFNQNYTIGTKNISAKMLESVEAIERFSENQVLRNLENSDKIAINLKLKKGENDFSKSISIGLGLMDKYFYDVNVIGVSYKFKTILASNFNTIGINNSPYDFINNIYFDNLKEMDYTLERKISSPITYFDVKNNYLDKNQNFLNTANNLYKINETATLGLNLSYTLDNIKIENTRKDDFFLENQVFSNHQANEINKKPKIFNASLNYLNNHKNSRIKIESTFKNWNTKENLNSVFNALSEQNSIDSDENLFSFNVSISKKLNDINAIDFNSFSTFYNGNQNLIFEQPKVLETLNINSQNVFSKKSIIENKFSLLGKKNNFKYNIGLYQRTNLENLKSKMRVVDLDYYENNINNTNSRWGFKTNFSYRFDKLFLSNENDLFINKNMENNQSVVKMNPSFNAQYNMSDKSNLGIKYQLKSTELNVNDLHSNFIFTNYYNLSNNISQYDFIDSQIFEAKFAYNNFIRDYIINLNASYNLTHKNLYSSFSFTDNFYINTFFLDKASNNHLSLRMNYKKLMPRLSSKVKTEINYMVYNTQSKYFDVLQQNKIVFWQYSFSYLSIFKGNLNFGNELKYSTNFSNNLEKKSLHNEFTVIYKKGKNHLFKVNNSWVVPEVKNYKNNIFLVNLEYFYFREKNTLSFTINNLTNSKYIYNFSVEENSTSIYSQKIMPIGFILKYNF